MWIRTSAWAEENQKNPQRETIKGNNFGTISERITTPITAKTPVVAVKMTSPHTRVNRQFEVRFIGYQADWVVADVSFDTA